VRRSVIFACTLVALAGPARALAQAPPAHDVTLAAAVRVVYGRSLHLTGTVAPAEAGLTVTIEQQSGGVWTPVVTATTDAAGAYAASFGATISGPLARASTTAVSARSIC
jgi:hypothetical protein